jgi:hypothetical protein
MATLAEELAQKFITCIPEMSLWLPQCVLR